MFTDKDFLKLFNTPGVRINALFHFASDKRLTSPFSIINDMGMKFGEYETYPEELGIIAINNGC